MNEQMLEVRPCGLCSNYVASYDGIETERACPIEAAAAILEIAAKGAADECE